ncbi:phosphoribosylamine--glycine ligase [Neoconidiobolus thromboides FSU 785]|nr:phosphoribosylamine--glycine ligase [Neoconidiobolus thromboides FSU 785]
MSDKELRILLLGSGGREHAIAWKLAQSQLVKAIFVAPGNGGIESIPKVKNVNIGVSDFDQLLKFAIENEINLLIPGPEQPLVEGVQNRFKKVGIPCFGPSELAARLEGSKAFSKDFMKKYNIPTARYQVNASNFTNYELALEYLNSLDYNVVIKASGLAAGKGVLIPVNKEEAVKDLKSVMVDKIFGDAGNEVVIEEYLEGQELSLLAFSDGYTIVPLLPSQDHKRAYDNDEGPNTGGMGCYCPTPLGTPQLMKQMYESVLLPTLKGMRMEKCSFIGMLFVGIMVTKDGAKVLEYNVRFGDPETEVVLPLLKTDLAEIMLACTEQRLDTINIEFNQGFATTVIVASGGYPNQYKKGIEIDINVNEKDVIVFHAGTKLENNKLVSNGGRVLSITGIGNTLEEAINKAYSGVSKINFPTSFYRSDIGKKGLKHEKVKLTYSSAGVDIDAGNELVEQIKSVVKSTKRIGTDSTIGGFGGLFDLKQLSYKDPILVSATDGVGTKLAVAHQTNIHDTIGIDLVAMSVNDLIVQGAEPLFFLDYFACGKLDIKTTADVVKGVANGCIESGCGLIGGETAEMPGLYKVGDYDLGGFAVGIVERENILPKMELIQENDVLIGLPSSGPHSNGYSLLRKVVELSGLNYNDPCPFQDNITLGKALLTPTKLYIKSLLPLIQKQLIKGMAHITGGGFIDNIPRVLPKNIKVKVNAKDVNLLPVFKWVKQIGNVDNFELARTFNCGIGMILIVGEENKDEVLNTLKELGQEAMIIGNTLNRIEDEEQVEMIDMEKYW